MKYLLFVVCLIYSLFANAQDAESQRTKDTAINGKVFSFVEQMPKPGFDIKKYLSKNLHYPDVARKHDIEGRVIIKFVVNEDGSIGDCKIIKGIGGGCDEEALRVIKNMPLWEPGKQNGEPVKVFFTQPIMFSLGSGKKKTEDGYVEHVPVPRFDLNEYLQANLHYPQAAKENNITGKVSVKFVVDKKGHIRDCQVIKGIGGGCDEEALRVVEEMPRWKPGTQKMPGAKKDTKVNVWFTLPIVFTLE